MSWVDQLIIFASGSIRGAIAFGMCLTLAVDQEKKQILVCTVLLTVFSTSIVLRGIIPLMIRVLKPQESRSAYNTNMYRQNKGGEYFDKLDSNEEKKSCWLKYWKWFENKVLCQILVSDWDKRVSEHEELARETEKIFFSFKNNRENDAIRLRNSSSASLVRGGKQLESIEMAE